MNVVRLGLSTLPGYAPVGNGALIIDGVSAAFHVYQYTEVTDTGSYEMTSVIYVLRRGSNVVVMDQTVFREDYQRLKPTLDRIANTLAIR
jgi:hypothetical protein